MSHLNNQNGRSSLSNIGKLIQVWADTSGPHARSRRHPAVPGRDSRSKAATDGRDGHHNRHRNRHRNSADVQDRNASIVWWPVLGLTGLALAGFGMRMATRWLRGMVHNVGRTFGDRLLSDVYGENLLEVATATARTGLLNTVEMSLRAEEGTSIQRPMGSPRRWPDFDQLVFDPAQLAKKPAAHDAVVDLSVTIGPTAKRPLQLDMPIIVSGIAYGLSVSKDVKIALARGATLAGTAVNGGEGPWQPLERQAARKFIMQFNRGTWAKKPHMLRRADMIEIQFGQGAAAGIGNEVFRARNDAALRTMLGFRPGQAPVMYSRQPELKNKTLRQLVDELRELTDGVPIGVKLAAGMRLEDDMQLAIDAGVDVIALDGAQAATKGSAPTLQDDFGIPTLHALVRAVKFLERIDRERRPSLIVGGGLMTPGDCLKALALGADAVYLGTMALFAVSHGQILKSLPWEPPTQLVFQGGKQAHLFDVDEGADRLAKFLRSCAAEIAVAVRAMGKTSLSDVSKDDMMALDEETARVCGVPVTFAEPAAQSAFSRQS